MAGKITLTACDKAAKQFSMLVRTRIVQEETSYKKIAPRIMMCAVTLSDKLRRRPQTFSFEEIFYICRALKITPEEMAAVICGKELPFYVPEKR